ncbi:MAG TPA: selenocysteine-specific translation elongation factor [Negativicutes bacterium]
MKYVIIGTAGHVDHGKSALIKALTGTDTDRLQEEKLRGISIDLGFASLALSQELMAGIVDVPGHERFLKNMLAGTGGIDMVMLVIAADEGVMPQTREHLAMLNLYGVQQGLVAINKIDKVDEEWLELVEEDIRSLLADTFLAKAPLCRVSALSGSGVAQLRQTLLTVAQTVTARDSSAPFRLWVDRVFTVKGHGAVVTGSVLSGAASIGDSLQLYPDRQSVRIRGLESHSHKVETIFAGQRAAINIAGVEMSEVERGMSLSEPERGQISNVWDVVVTWHQEVDSGTRIRLHLGTGEFLGRLYQFKNVTNTYMRLMLEKPLAAGAGDRGIIRLYSPQYLLGGVMLVAPSKKSRNCSAARCLMAQALKRQDVTTFIRQLLVEYGPMIGEEVRRKGGYIRDEELARIMGQLVAEGSVMLLEPYYIEQSTLAVLTEKVRKLLKDYHQEQPDRPGLSRELIKQKLAMEDRTFETVLGYWQQKQFVITTGADIALKEHAAKHSDWKQELVAKAEIVLDNTGLQPITFETVVEKLKLPPDKSRAAFDTLIHQGVLIRVGELYVYRKTIQNIVKLIQNHFQKQPTLTVAELRDMLNTSRKVALPLLEYFDLHKYTIREGDIRRSGLKIKDLSE